MGSARWRSLDFGDAVDSNAKRRLKSLLHKLQSEAQFKSPNYPESENSRGVSTGMMSVIDQIAHEFSIDLPGETAPMMEAA